MNEHPVPLLVACRHGAVGRGNGQPTGKLPSSPTIRVTVEVPEGVGVGVGVVSCGDAVTYGRYIQIRMWRRREDLGFWDGDLENNGDLITIGIELQPPTNSPSCRLRFIQRQAHIILVGHNRPTATTILARLEKPPVPGLTREFLPCDLTLIANAKRAAAVLRARFPRIHFLSSPRMAALYHSKWMFIERLLLALRAVHGAGEDAHVAALHTAGRGGPVDLDDLGLMKGISGGLKSLRKLVPQLASYPDLMAEAFAAHDSNTGISFTHAFPGTVDTPLLRASPSAIPCAVHYVRFLLFPTLMFRAMSISECGEYQLYGTPGTSRTGGTGEDIGRPEVRRGAG
ncbi:hypothetical protein B0H13DRAFT_2439152 [Mycena leptocephala]|nr:hypothetical protein B0H13DRAFT_2439152 [Mycena leptocephala]